jgi:hypothetical protein
LGLWSIVVKALPAFFHKPDRAGAAVLAVDFRVPAFHAFLAKVHAVLHAEESAFDFRVACTFTHGSLYRKTPFILAPPSCSFRQSPFPSPDKTLRVHLIPW